VFHHRSLREHIAALRANDELQDSEHDVDCTPSSLPAPCPTYDDFIRGISQGTNWPRLA
jgi:hypothetical protein